MNAYDDDLFLDSESEDEEWTEIERASQSSRDQLLASAKKSPRWKSLWAEAERLARAAGMESPLGRNLRKRIRPIICGAIAADRPDAVVCVDIQQELSGSLEGRKRASGFVSLHEDRLFWIGEDSDSPTPVVRQTLSRLPEEVRQWAIDALIWFCPPSCNGQAVTCTLDTYMGGPEPRFPVVLRLVYIAPHVFDESEAEQQRAIAHEIAHQWLNHIGPATAGEHYQAREAEVEAELAKWGFVNRP